MALKNNKKLSIQITDTSINILIASKNKIFEAHTISLENGDCRDGNIRDKENIIRLLNDYLDFNARDVKNVSFVLRGSDIITRYTEVPILKDDALREAVSFEFNQFIPDIEDYYTNFEIIEKISTQEKKAYKILLVAAPMQKIDPIVEIAEAIGKELEVIDILSNTLARVLKSSDHLVNDESTGVFYFGADSSTLSIIENNILKFERNLPFGVKNIFNDVYDQIAATTLDSREVSSLFEKNSSVTLSFENLLYSVNNTIRYYNSEKSNKPVTNFIIICSDIFMDNMEKYLEKYFELPCIVVKEPFDLGLKLKFEKNFPKYMACYGLLLREGKNKLLNLNPKAIIKEKKKSNIDGMLLRIPIVTLSGVLLVGCSFLAMNSIISKDITSIEGEITKYNEIVEKNTALKTENKNMEYFIDRVKNIENSTSKTSLILSKINSLVPKEITFMNLSFSDTGSINITGESDTYDAIAEFLANLQMSQEFCNATISYINPVEKVIEIAEKTKSNDLGKSSLFPLAMVGNRNIWDNIFLASDDSKENTNSNNLNSVQDNNSLNGQSDSNNTNTTNDKNNNSGTNSNNNSNTGNNNSNTNNSNGNNSNATNNGSNTNNNNNSGSNSNGTNKKNTKTITKYNFSISIEGVSKDGSKAKTKETK